MFTAFQVVLGGQWSVGTTRSSPFLGVPLNLA
jgi:hypothetical protein